MQEGRLGGRRTRESIFLMISINPECNKDMTVWQIINMFCVFGYIGYML